MLSALDETLLHQAPVPFAQTLNSDHRFFDRMWIGGHDSKGSRFHMGLAVYKNTNTLDGFFSVLKGDRQYNLRVSRPLLPDPGALKAGPLSAEIVTPLERIRVVVEAGPDHPFEADLTFVGTIPARLEKSQFGRLNGRITQDYTRFDQHGEIEGWFSIDGEKVDATGWFGARDHSWGVRPSVGGYEPTTSVDSDDSFGGQLSGKSGGLLAIYLFFETAEFGGYIQQQEDADGKLLYLDGGITPHGGSEIRLKTLQHDLTFVPGTRTCSKGLLTGTLDNGETVSVEFNSLLPGTVFKGTGYDNGFDDERGLGFHRGELVEYDVYDVSDPEAVVLPDGRTIRPWQRELPCTVIVDGREGMGYAAVLNNGHIKRYGLTGEISNRRPAA